MKSGRSGRRMTATRRLDWTNGIPPADEATP